MSNPKVADLAKEDPVVLNTHQSLVRANRQLHPMDGIATATPTASSGLFSLPNHGDDGGEPSVHNHPPTDAQASHSMSNTSYQQQSNQIPEGPRARPDRNAYITGVPRPKRPALAGRGRVIELPQTQSTPAKSSNPSNNTTYVHTTAQSIAPNTSSNEQQRGMDKAGPTSSSNQDKSIAEAARTPTRPVVNSSRQTIARPANPPSNTTNTDNSSREAIPKPSHAQALRPNVLATVKWEDRDKTQKMNCLSCGHEQICRGFSHSSENECDACGLSGFMRVPESVLQVRRVPPPRQSGTASYVDPRFTGFIDFEYQENGDIIR